MPKSNKRKALRARNGERFRLIATVQRFGSRRGWKGRDESTILLVDLSDADNASKLCDHLWFRTGKWTEGLKIDDHVRFEARASSYEKGYRGYRDDVFEAPTPSTDWRLERPTKVEKLAKQRGAQFEAEHFAEACKSSALRKKRGPVARDGGRGHCLA